MSKRFNHLPHALLLALMAASSFGAHAQSESAGSAKQSRPVALKAQSEQESLQPQLSGASFSAYCLYRYAGTHVNVRCYDGRINANSRVFLSLSEYFSGPSDRGIGAARMTVHNIRPFNGGVDAWTDVEWGSPLSVRMDLLVDP